ncbi:hypothetical protein ACFQBQ_10170 [Granulicella cerasi]|uniref:Uncharacterized protein n=1 Tax=Granulicella cerasi TaxID=741063 RepID=A0ABW1Z9Q2_9BACT
MIGIGGTAAVNLVREFILPRISSGIPKYGHGKPSKEASKQLQP